MAADPEFPWAFVKRKMFYIERPEQLTLSLDNLRKAGPGERCAVSDIDNMKPRMHGWMHSLAKYERSESRGSGPA